MFVKHLILLKSNPLQGGIMENLSIKNFVSLKEVNIELSKINIFIGPQAKGKSLIAKLISYFKSIPLEVTTAITEGKNKRELTSNLKIKFEKMFPRYTWENCEFSISYKNKFYSVTIENKKNINKNIFSITCSEEIDKSIKFAKKYLNKLDETMSSEPPMGLRFRRIEELRAALTSCLFKDNSNSRIEQIMYIPAGRSFFANLQKNVFSFLSSSINIDYFLTEFGSIYEQTKNAQFTKYAQKGTPPQVNKLVESLICGKHTTEKGQDWITTEHGRINVANSSSGQQEALPMALILATWPYVRTNQICRSFVIEEPEAHLFPFAQGTVVSMIANSHHASYDSCSHTITTHSPYILTAMNNLIQSGNAENALRENSASPDEFKKLYAITPKEEIIYFDEVRAYIIDNGTATNILNKELKLIDANSIDKISNIFSEKFNSLVEMEMISRPTDNDDDIIDFGNDFIL